MTKHNTVYEFRNQYNIKLPVDITVEAWNDVTKICLHGAWHKVLSDLIYNSKSFEPSEDQMGGKCTKGNRLNHFEFYFKRKLIWFLTYLHS